MEENAEKLLDDAVELTLRGDFEKALSALNKAITPDPRFASHWFIKGNNLYDSGHYEEAIQSYDKAIQLNTEEKGDPWHQKGDALCKLSRYDEALKAYDKAIEIDKKLSARWHETFKTLNNSGHSEEAMKAFDKAIKLNSKLEHPWHGMGNTLFILRRYNEANNAYKKSIELNPNFDFAWYGMGNTLRVLEQYDEAIRAYDRAIELNPKFAFPWNGKGFIYSENSPEIALCYLRRSYFLLWEKRYFFESPNTFMNLFKNQFIAPLFVHRIFQDLPILYTYQRFASLAADTEEQCEEALLMLKFLESRQDFPSRVENLKLKGLIHYYFGDPEISKTVFERIDDLDDSDLMGQYYLILSMDGYSENRDQELRFAVEKAREALASFC